MIRVFNRYVSAKSIILAMVEAGLLALTLVGAVRIRFWNDVMGFRSYVELPAFGIQALAFVAILQICFYYCDLYDFDMLCHRPDQFLALGQSIGSGCLLLAILYFVFPGLLIGRGVFFISIALVAAVLLLTRVVLDRIWRLASPIENVLIIGTGQLAHAVAGQMTRRPDLNFRVAGFLTTSPENGDRDGGRFPVLGAGQDLVSVVRSEAVSRIVVALEDRRGVLPTRDLVRLRVEGIRVEDATTTVSALTGRVWLETVKPSWFVFSDGFRRSLATLIAKRTIDLVCGIVGLVLSLPAMAAIAIAVRLDSKGPIIYRQQRVGLKGACFEVLKFRSMRVDAEAGGTAQWAVDQDPRVTRLGGFLRKYRLDELPQFMNVVRGEMSFVGPRPERPEFVDVLRKEIPYYDERHSVRPGLTGWAQVRYPYGSTVTDAIRKLEYDLFYLKNMSVFFDCAIILDTVRIVLHGRGAK